MASGRRPAYELIELVGEGGWAKSGRRGTRASIASSPSSRCPARWSSRYKQEARAISALTHPHICTLYDLGVDEGTPYLVMEFVEDETMRGPVSLRYAEVRRKRHPGALRLGMAITSLNADC